jgi:hypothetical protein
MLATRTDNRFASRHESDYLRIGCHLLAAVDDAVAQRRGESAHGLWVGRHFAEQPNPVHVLMGLDPL